MNAETARALTDAIARLHTRPSLSDIPTYKGRTDKTTFLEILEKMNVIFALHDIEADAERAKTLMAAMRGPAIPIFERIYNAWKADRANPVIGNRRTYKDLTIQLATEFKTPGTAATFRKQFNARRKQNNESIEEFARELSKMAIRAFSEAEGFNDEIREKLIVTAFMQGLPDGIRIQVQRNQNITTLKDAIQHALLEEDILQESAPLPDNIVAAVEKLITRSEQPQNLSQNNLPYEDPDNDGFETSAWQPDSEQDQEFDEDYSDNDNDHRYAEEW